MPKKATPSKVRTTKSKAGKAVKKPIRKRTKSRAKALNKKAIWPFIKSCLFKILLIICVFIVAWGLYLDLVIRDKFEGQKWALPAHVYTRAMDVYVGQKIPQKSIVDELLELGYQPQVSSGQVDSPGKYSLQGSQLVLFQREFTFADNVREAQRVRIEWQGNTIIHIVVNSIEGGEGHAIQIEPRLFGSVSPLNHEDRKLITLEETPEILVDTLLAIEDRKFYRHFGVDPIGILRAMVTNVSAGRTVQGGSTLTQQLVKNYFLTPERTLKRKVTELMMALLLELRYSKDEILQAYLNEVNLGQSGNRAIHGFGLGSQFLFGRPLAELEVHQQAMLVAMVKGPTYYNPIRKPERAKKRRNVVLDVMFKQEIIDQQTVLDQKALPLNTLGSSAQQAKRSYPAFTGFVRKQLNSRYQVQDLNESGLSIFTTIDPRAQRSLDKAIQISFNEFGAKAKGLQVAAISLRTDNGEVIAMSGSKESSLGGFNRALNAKRPIGSLIKPFVLLSALQNKPEKFQLNSLILDDQVTITQNGSPDWTPQNYDKKFHGNVILMDALAKSYNIPFVKLGMDVGVGTVLDTLVDLGLDQRPAKLPSLLLGSLELSPVEVSQLYLTLASGGFRSPITTVNAVLNEDKEPLESFELNIQQVSSGDVNNQVVRSLQEVFSTGTARRLNNAFPGSLNLAGKTGTTDGYRDSWFAGFSGDVLTVVWLGRDDNKPTGLTGSTGAGQVWKNYMSQLQLMPIDLFFSEKTEKVFIPSMLKSNQGSVQYGCGSQRTVFVSALVDVSVDCDDDDWQAVNDDGRMHKQKSVNRIGRFLKKIFN